MNGSEPASGRAGGRVVACSIADGTLSCRAAGTCDIAGSAPGCALDEAGAIHAGRVSEKARAERGSGARVCSRRNSDRRATGGCAAARAAARSSTARLRATARARRASPLVLLIVEVERLVERGQHVRGQHGLHLRLGRKSQWRLRRERAALTHALLGAGEQRFELRAHLRLRNLAEPGAGFALRTEAERDIGGQAGQGVTGRPGRRRTRGS